MWPLNKKRGDDSPSSKSFLEISLTASEREEVDRELQVFGSLLREKEGSWYLPVEVADVVQRSLIAEALSARAERLVGQAERQSRDMNASEAFNDACSSALKATLIFQEEPLYMYRLARICERAGREQEARGFFEGFLSEQAKTQTIEGAYKVLVERAIAYSKSRLSR
jgi:hypothetical protein